LGSTLQGLFRSGEAIHKNHV